MALTLSNLKPAKGSQKNKKRIGRGNASGHGTYSTRGLKGQRSRSGSKKGLKLKGLKARLQKIPKLRGFKSAYPKAEPINLTVLEKNFESGSEVNIKRLHNLGLIKKNTQKVKILGAGSLTKKLTIRGCLVSTQAKEAIERSGGKVA